MAAYELNNTILKNSSALKAYYRFSTGDLTTDSSGNSKTLTNNGTVADGTGVYGGAADFGASNSTKYLTIADNLGIDGGAGSISCWIKLNAEIGSGYWYFANVQGTTTDTALAIWYDYNGGTRRVNFGRLRNGAAWDSALYTANLGTSSWYHLVLTYDATTIRGYVNGKYITGTAASGNGTANHSNGASVGGDPGGGGLASILADDVAFFNTALSADQIKELYEGRFIGESWPQSGLVAGYHLNGSSTDFSGNNNHGADTAITYSQANGKFGQGAGFNGSTSYITLGTSATLNPSLMSVSFWANIANTATTGRVISRDDVSTNRCYDIGYGGTTGTAPRIFFEIHSGGVVGSSTDIPNNTWHHVVCTFDGSTVKVYLNGNLDGSANHSGTVPSKTVATQIGRRNTTLYLNGKLEEILIFNRALSAQEIRRMYAVGTGKLSRYA